MENPTVTGLRSRSRSKTPFLRSSCDREHCTEGDDHTHHHKSGRKTPVKRSTPIKQLNQPSKMAADTIEEEEVSRPHRTRQSTRMDKSVKTSDYSSEESLDRLKASRKEIVQNEINSQYERVSTSRRYGTLEDLPFSPINVSSLTNDRSARFGSPAYSACSTDSSFAEQALADASLLLEREPVAEHLPSRLYRMAGEYWNKYPKTDYTYSPLSKDRVELAPGQVAVPNMSRRSLSQFRVQGPNTSVDELDRLTKTTSWSSSKLRKRFTTVDSSDDEGTYLRGNGGYTPEQRWWLTQLLISVITTITTSVSSSYRTLVGPSHRYPYTDRRPQQPSLASRVASGTAAAVTAPFYWAYMIIKKVVTTTVTTVTETITPNHVSASETHVSRSYHAKEQAKRRWWPWLLLLLLPLVGYGSHYTYEHLDELAMPNFTDFRLDLPEFSAIQLPEITLPSLPNITLPEISLPTISMPEINITLPDISENLPEVKKTYHEYKDIVQNRMADASEYVKVVAESCYEELRRFWRGIIG